jgi:hypothetical protein
VINLSKIQFYGMKIFTGFIFLASMAILVATSSSDIAAVDSEMMSATLNKDQEQIGFLFTFSKGPFDFENLPLIVNIEISHDELNEEFDFQDQSWVLSTSTLDGSELKTRVLFRRGDDGILTADYGKYTLSGTTSLYGCQSSLGQDNQTDVCIPCESSADTCSFKFELIREGAPYPAEKVKIQASQWLIDMTSTVQLEVSVDR